MEYQFNGICPVFFLSFSCIFPSFPIFFPVISLHKLRWKKLVFLLHVPSRTFFRQEKPHWSDVQLSGRGWRVSASWTPDWGSPWNRSDNHSTIALRWLRGPLNWSFIMVIACNLFPSKTIDYFFLNFQSKNVALQNNFDHCFGLKRIINNKLTIVIFYFSSTLYI